MFFLLKLETMGEKNFLKIKRGCKYISYPLVYHNEILTDTLSIYGKKLEIILCVIKYTYTVYIA